MPLTLPHTFVDGPGNTASGVEVMDNLNAINAGVAAATVTALPGSPVNGQECHFLADATNGVVWHLKYRSASASAYKWEFVGGGALRAVSVGQVFATAAELAGWTNLTGAPAITSPLAGDFIAGVGAQIGVAGGALGQIGYIGVAIGNTTPAWAAAHGEEQHTFVGGTSFDSVMTRAPFTGVLAAQVFQTRHSMGGSLAGSGAVSWALRWLEVTPVRVG